MTKDQAWLLFRWFYTITILDKFLENLIWCLFVCKLCDSWWHLHSFFDIGFHLFDIQMRLVSNRIKSSQYFFVAWKDRFFVICQDDPKKWQMFSSSTCESNSQHEKDIIKNYLSLSFILCAVCLRKLGQYFLSSSFCVFILLYSVT